MTLARTEFRRKAPPTDPKVKTRRCALKGCTERFVQKSMAHRGCCPEHAIQIVQDEKARKLKSERQAGLKALKRRADYLKEAQQAFNAFIRERDRDKPCISSGRPLQQEAIGGGYDCGHYRSVGSAPHLRFDERNAHGQSKHDNRYLSGNVVEYRKGLINRYNLEFVEELEADNTPRKYSIPDLKNIAAYYRGKLKEIRG